MCTGITPRYTDHTLRAQKVSGTQKYCMCTDPGAQACNRLQSRSIDTRAHTHRYPPTHKRVLGWGGSFLILHKAGPLRGAPRHRGPLLTKPPAGSKSDPPSRLQRGQGTRLPCPPPPPRSARLLRSGRGRGRPAAARGVSQRLPRTRTGPPAPGRAAPLWRPRSRRHSQPRRGVLQPDAAACAPSAGARPGGCQAQRARESGARSCRPFTPQRQSPPCPV